MKNRIEELNRVLENRIALINSSDEIKSFNDDIMLLMRTMDDAKDDIDPEIWDRWIDIKDHLIGISNVRFNMILRNERLTPVYNLLDKIINEAEN